MQLSCFCYLISVHSWARHCKKDAINKDETTDKCRFKRSYTLVYKVNSIVIFIKNRIVLIFSNNQIQHDCDQEINPQIRVIFSHFLIRL